MNDVVQALKKRIKDLNDLLYYSIEEMILDDQHKKRMKKNQVIALFILLIVVAIAGYMFINK